MKIYIIATGIAITGLLTTGVAAVNSPKQVEVTQTTEVSSNLSLLTVDQRFLDWKKNKQQQPIHALVQFDKIRSDQQVKQILEKSGAKPYQVFMFLNNEYGSTTIDPQDASLAIIDGARSRSIEMSEKHHKGIQARASRFLKEGFKEGREIAEDLAFQEADRKANLKVLRGNVPIIYAVKVVASEEGLKSIEKSQQVSLVEPGYILPNAIAVPDPMPPEQKLLLKASKKSDKQLEQALKNILNEE